MKKENRKAAQERRAQERAAEARKAKMRVWIPTILIIAAFVVLIVGIVMTSGCVGDSNADTDDTTTVSETVTAASAVEDEEETLDTTEGLVAEDGDTVNIDYVGSIDGVEFDGGSTNGLGADLTLGSGTYIDGFEEQVVGHSVGETFDIEVTFPENYGSSDLAGQDAVFTITLNGIYK